MSTPDSFAALRRPWLIFVGGCLFLAGGISLLMFISRDELQYDWALAALRRARAAKEAKVQDAAKAYDDARNKK